jgi:hypothetical protein
LDDQYFTQTLLPDYLTENPQTTSNWDVVFDARGHFAEPHTRVIVPLGTLDVRNYLAKVASRAENGDGPQIDLGLKALFPTCGPCHRFGAILFIEKEGFLPLFKAVNLAERFDIAIMSTKGLSVTASRLLVDRLCGQYDVPLLVLHDFDKSGFSIIGTLRRDTRRYSFTNAIRVVDLGLRLQDVEHWGLEAEFVAYGKSNPSMNLYENGATKEEVAFLFDEERSSWEQHVGQRVELNAFSSRDLVTWIEQGLIRHGVKKVLPNADALQAAFRRSAAQAILKRRVEEVISEANEEAECLTLPATLESDIKARMGTEPTLPWDRIVSDAAAELVRTNDSSDDDSAS